MHCAWSSFARPGERRSAGRCRRARRRRRRRLSRRRRKDARASRACRGRSRAAGFLAASPILTRNQARRRLECSDDRSPARGAGQAAQPVRRAAPCGARARARCGRRMRSSSAGSPSCASVIRPAFETAAAILTERGHKVSVVEQEFSVDPAASVTEAMISLHIVPSGTQSTVHDERGRALSHQHAALQQDGVDQHRPAAKVSKASTRWRRSTASSSRSSSGSSRASSRDSSRLLQTFATTLRAARPRTPASRAVG